MKKVDSSLLCLELGSIAAGYLSLNAATQGAGLASPLRILEATPIGARFLILALGAEAELRAALDRVRALFDEKEPSIVIDAEIISEVDQRVNDALYALSQALLGESLVVVETANVSGILAVAQAMVEGHGLEPIEIRIQRSSTGGAYGFFTGSKEASAPAASDARARLTAAVRKGRVEVIDNPSSTFRSFFDITGIG